MKNKTIALFGIMAICLLTPLLYTEGYYTGIEKVDYPETVFIGKSFEVTVTFDYNYATSSLYGDYVYLYYSVGTNPVVDLTQYVTVDISQLENAPAPKPVSVKFKIDTDDFACKINDTFVFRIGYNEGLNFYPEETIYDMGATYSDSYYLELIENPNAINFSIIGFLAPLLLLSTVFIMRKKNIGEKT